MATAVDQRQFHVKVYFAHVKGDTPVSAEDSYITFARTYTVNDVFVAEDWAELCFSPFGQLVLMRPSEIEGFPGRHPDLVRPYEELLESLTLDDRLEVEGDEIAIPVSTIEFVEGNWFDS